MPQLHPAPTRSSREMRSVRARLLGCPATLLLSVLLLSTIPMAGQSTTAPASSQGPAAPAPAGFAAPPSFSSSDDDSTVENRSMSSTAVDYPSSSALSSDQIINILDQSPDLLNELKSQLADQMEQQGVQIDPSDISDQMLYSQISTSARLRANITTVLVARGYVTESDLAAGGESPSQGSRIDSMSASSGSLLAADNATPGGGSLPGSSSTGAADN